MTHARRGRCATDRWVRVTGRPSPSCTPSAAIISPHTRRRLIWIFVDASCRPPLARSARTPCTSVVRPSASTARREISSALPRQECLHGLDQSGRVLPASTACTLLVDHTAPPRAVGTSVRARPLGDHTQPRPGRTLIHDATHHLPAAAPAADPAAVHAMRGAHHLVVAPPVRVEHIPRAATRPKHRPQGVRRLMSGEQDVRSAATHQPQARRWRRMTTRRVLRAPCLRLPLASLSTMTRTRGLKLRRKSLLAGPDDPSRPARSPSILGATAGRDRARPRRDQEQVVTTSAPRGQNAAPGSTTGPGPGLMPATAPVHRDRPTRPHPEQDHGSTPMMSMVVTWLMKNPLGAVAQSGARGDFVRVSDGRATIYLLPHEFHDADERRLRWLLARQPTQPS